MPPARSRLPLARLGRAGARARKGLVAPPLRHLLTAPQTSWSTLTVTSWYGGGAREVQVRTDTAVWYQAGLPPVALRWVLLRDPQGEFAPQALRLTHLGHSPAQIVHWFVRRWTMEVTVAEPVPIWRLTPHGSGLSWPSAGPRQPCSGYRRWCPSWRIPCGALRRLSSALRRGMPRRGRLSLTRLPWSDGSCGALVIFPGRSSAPK